MKHTTRGREQAHHLATLPTGGCQTLAIVSIDGIHQLQGGREQVYNPSHFTNRRLLPGACHRQCCCKACRFGKPQQMGNPLKTTHGGQAGQGRPVGLQARSTDRRAFPAADLHFHAGEVDEATTQKKLSTVQKNLVKDSGSLFAECKLTQVLTEPLSGACGTVILATVSTTDYHETTGLRPWAVHGLQA